MSASIYIGTSGWNYDEWQPDFYPEGLPQSKWLPFYAERFRTVEINNSFYNLPSEETIVRWRDSTPDDMLFAVKASQYITHMKKLKEPEEALDNFLERIEKLGHKLGPILFQLPPRWHYNGERLRDFLTILPEHFRYAFELRDPDWITEDARELLAEYDTAFCIYDLRAFTSPRWVTTNFVYVRLHGPLKEPYQGAYDTQALSEWAGAFSSWAAQGKDVFCYFDNTAQGDAIHDAQKLRDMLQKK